MLIAFYCIKNFLTLHKTHYVMLLNEQIDKELMSSLLRNFIHGQHKFILKVLLKILLSQ